MQSGHNGIAADQLRSIVERVERLEEDKREIGDQIKEVYAESKGNGFDPRIIKKIVALRRKADDARREEQELLELYAGALQMELFN